MPSRRFARAAFRDAGVPQNGPVISTELRQVDYHDPDAQLLIDEVQQEYVRRYGGPDDTPVDRDEFSPPNGHFVVLYEAGRPVAMGGWRFSEEARAVLGDPDLVVELKRMYVIPASRGRGHARTVLAHLEQTAAAAGAGRMVLETGAPQPEAVALYRSSGYAADPRVRPLRRQPAFDPPREAALPRLVTRHRPVARCEHQARTDLTCGTIRAT